MVLSTKGGVGMFPAGNMVTLRFLDGGRLCRFDVPTARIDTLSGTDRWRLQAEMERGELGLEARLRARFLTDEP